LLAFGAFKDCGTSRLIGIGDANSKQKMRYHIYLFLIRKLIRPDFLHTISMSQEQARPLLKSLAAFGPDDARRSAIIGKNRKAEKLMTSKRNLE